jgi:signal transduction histidine kinase
LFEAYVRYDAVATSGSRLWRSFAPISLGALILLELVQIPLAWSLARRLRERLREREGLLQRALDASEVERREIASDLHDGVVQDLAGMAYSFSGVARQATEPSQAQLYESSADHIRQTIKALRSLVVEIYPPNLEEEGLESALSDLLARSRPRGVSPELDTSRLVAPLPAAMSRLMYRAAQELLRNVLRHAEAASIWVRVSASGGVVILEVEDDGHGFESSSDAPAGHVGLRGLAGLVADAGGTMRVRSSPGRGTTVRVEVPLP